MQPELPILPMFDRRFIALVSLLAFIIGNVGLPIMSPEASRLGKRSRLSGLGLADQRQGEKSTHPEQNGRGDVSTPDSPNSSAPLIGFLISVQPRLSAVVVEVPQLVELCGSVPLFAPLAPPSAKLPPDTPPPRPTVG